MQCPNSASVYSELWEIISKQKCNPKNAVMKLSEFFSKTPTLPIPLVLVVDELDVIICKNQEIIYNLLDWPNSSDSNMIVIAIANTADLPERMFKNRVISRLNPSHVEFKPYTYLQLVKIAHTRTKNYNVFDDKTIEYCSRKVASVTGDARRLLALLRRAIELYEISILSSSPNMQTARFNKIGIDWINAALKKSYQFNSCKHITSLTLHQKLLLISFINLCSNIANPTPTISMLMQEYCRVSNLYSTPFFGIHSLPDLINSLLEKRIFVLGSKTQLDLKAIVSLNFPPSDILQELKSDPDRHLMPLVSIKALQSATMSLE